MLTSERTFRNLLLSFTLGIAPLFVLPAHAGRPVDAFVTTPHHLACSDLLAHINYQDLVVRSKEGRASLDATLKQIARELQSPVKSTRETLIGELSYYLYPLFVHTAESKHPYFNQIAHDAVFDALQTALFRIVKNIENGSYEANSSFGFFSYAYSHFRFELLHAARTSNPNKSVYRHPIELIDTDELDSLELPPEPVSPYPLFLIVSEACNKLKGDERMLLFAWAQGASDEKLSRGTLTRQAINDRRLKIVEKVKVSVRLLRREPRFEDELGEFPEIESNHILLVLKVYKVDLL